MFIQTLQNDTKNIKQTSDATKDRFSFNYTGTSGLIKDYRASGLRPLIFGLIE